MIPNNRSFRVLTLFVLISTLLLSTVEARFRRPDLANIPVMDLVATLEKKVKAEPRNATLRMNLGRVYAMAYSRKTDQLQINKQKPEQAWFGYTPPHVPFSYVTEAKDKAASVAARENLKKAIEQFEAAVKLDEKNLPAQLSLAWCLEQSGKKEKAKDAYREIIKAGWDKEKDMTRAGLGWHSIVGEAAQYLTPMLDKDMEQAEIKDLKTKLAKIAKIARPMTPIAVPMRPSMSLKDIINRDATVRFDVDGSDLGREWSWISRDAAWLVYDKKGTGKIESGLQLFGNVTFWCFWDNGYQALSCLDANQDGVLSGNELKHLGLWQDQNENGISEAGEVRTLAQLGIVEINCQYQTLPTKNRKPSSVNAVATSQAGVKFADGSTRATYDVVLHQK